MRNTMQFHPDLRTNPVEPEMMYVKGLKPAAFKTVPFKKPLSSIRKKKIPRRVHFRSTATVHPSPPRAVSSDLWWDQRALRKRKLEELQIMQAEPDARRYLKSCRYAMNTLFYMADHLPRIDGNLLSDRSLTKVLGTSPTQEGLRKGYRGLESIIKRKVKPSETVKTIVLCTKLRPDAAPALSMFLSAADCNWARAIALYDRAEC